MPGTPALLFVALSFFLVACGSNSSSDPQPITYTVTATAGAGGSITPASSTIDAGGTARFDVTPAVGYGIASVSGCGGSLSGSSYTTGTVTAACAVVAAFEVTLQAPANLTATAGDGEVRLTWGQVAEATGYNLYWSRQPDIHPANAASYDDLATNVTSPQTLGGLDNDQVYFFLVTATAGAAEGPGSQEVTATPTAPPSAPTAPLNDTGQAQCLDNDLLTDCTQATTGDGSGHPGQDGRYGRDAAFSAGAITKHGAGVAGFDFTKLDATGGELATDAPGWHCVRDNVTGLIWDVTKTELFTFDGAATHSDTVGARDLCGFDDWRVPSRRELLSIIDYDVRTASLDADYFPRAAAIWSGDIFAPDPASAWLITDGLPTPESKSASHRVLLVRGGQAPINPALRFATRGDGTVTDRTTGLVWDQCLWGQTWTLEDAQGACSGAATTHTWSEALKLAVEQANPNGHRGHSDWRLPNITEMESLVDLSIFGPAIDAQAFPGAATSAAWSSTVSGEPGAAWLVEFGEGGVLEDADRFVPQNVRLVRNAQTFDALAPQVRIVNLFSGSAALEIRKSAESEPIAVVAYRTSTAPLSLAPGSYAFDLALPGAGTVAATSSMLQLEEGSRITLLLHPSDVAEQVAVAEIIDDLSAPAPGNRRVRVGFAARPPLRLEAGTLVYTNPPFQFLGDIELGEMSDAQEFVATDFSVLLDTDKDGIATNIVFDNLSLPDGEAANLFFFLEGGVALLFGQMLVPGGAIDFLAEGVIGGD